MPGDEPALQPDLPYVGALLQAEHRSIEAVLTEASIDATDPGWPLRLVRALYDVREHILKEQDGVFRLASLAILRPEDWDLIPKALRAHASAELS